MGMVLLLLWACETVPDWCTGRGDDADCDGTPDMQDRCDGTTLGSLVDRRGCSEEQAAGCSVHIQLPEDRAQLSKPSVFRWEGSCEHYLLQFSDDPDFTPLNSQTLYRGVATEVHVTPTARWWRVVGGNQGASSGFSTPPRRL